MKSYIVTAGLFLFSTALMAQSTKLIAKKSGKGAVITHTVQSGEGLYSLAKVYGVSGADIANANGFKRNKNLSIGQKVNIPLTNQNLLQKKGKTAVYYKVSDGESLGGISKRFNNVAIKDLQKWNKISGQNVHRDKEIIVGYFSGKPATAKADKETAKNTDSKKSASKTAIISGSDINIRKGPSTDAEAVGVAQQDDVVTITKKRKEKDEWVSVRTKDGVEGYIASRFLQSAPSEKARPEKPTNPEKTAKLKTATVYGTNINIRKAPATDKDVVAIAQEGDAVAIIKKVNDEWTEVRAADGTEGYIASRFLEPKAKTAEAPAPKVATVFGTNINVRKGPSTDEDVVSIVQQDETIELIKNVNSEWASIRTQDGTEGYIASRFLVKEGEAPPVAANNPSPSETTTVQNKVEANPPSPRVANEDGYFKQDFEKESASKSQKTFSSGIFKTDRGWNDGKYYLLMDDAAAGSVVKITNPENKKTVYARVLGKMKGVQYSNNLDIRISEAAATKLQANHLEKFNVSVAY